MPKIEVLIGMIASGKTTYARRRADEGALVISHDDLTEMLHTRYRYDASLRPVYLEMLGALARVALRSGLDVVVDRTHLTREARANWVQRAKWWGVPVVAVVFPVEAPDVHAARRAATNDRGRPPEEWLAAAKHHYAQHLAEPLDWKTEGFDGLVEMSEGGLAVLATRPEIPTTGDQ
jgi:predicted kinase